MTALIDISPISDRIAVPKSTSPGLGDFRYAWVVGRGNPKCLKGLCREARRG